MLKVSRKFLEELRSELLRLVRDLRPKHKWNSLVQGDVHYFQNEESSLSDQLLQLSLPIAHLLWLYLVNFGCTVPIRFPDSFAFWAISNFFTTENRFSPHCCCRNFDYPKDYYSHSIFVAQYAFNFCTPSTIFVMILGYRCRAYTIVILFFRMGLTPKADVLRLVFLGHEKA